MPTRDALPALVGGAWRYERCADLRHRGAGLLAVVLDGADYPPGARYQSNPLMTPAKNNGGQQGGRRRAVFIGSTDVFVKNLGLEGWFLLNGQRGD